MGIPRIIEDHVLGPFVQCGNYSNRFFYLQDQVNCNVCGAVFDMGFARELLKRAQCTLETLPNPEMTASHNWKGVIRKKHYNIGIDLDGVLANVADAAARLWYEKGNTIFNKSMITHWDWYMENLHISRKQMLELLDEAWLNWYRLDPENAENIQALTNLHKAGHKITIVTNRSRGSIPCVINWFHKWNVIYDALVFNSLGLPKMAYPIDILVDDNPREFTKSLDFQHKMHIIYDQPWNHDLYPFSPRVGSLTELHEVLRRDSGQIN